MNWTRCGTAVQISLCVCRHVDMCTVQDGKTALILAAEKGYASVVVSLLEAEADIKIDYQTEVSSPFN